MAGFFNLPSAKSLKKKDMDLAKKSKTSKSINTVTIKGGGSLIDKIQSIVSLVNSKFANKKDEFLLIRTEEAFIEYIDKCIENNIISIDTETTGLDPIEDHIVGLCIYTPGMKAAYVPVNHISYITQAKVENQLSVEFLREQLRRISINNVRTYWFNAPFDVRFIGHTIGIWLPIYWDASIASRILNSSEPRGERGLKQLHKKYCRGNKGEAFSFDKLFEGIPFNLIPINTAYLYAANDAVITYELAHFQEKYLDPTSPLNKEKHLEGLSYVFFNIEMASMPVFIEMEENGVTIDMEYAKTVSKKYHEFSEKTQKRAQDVLNQYKDDIDAYRRATPGCKLTDPVNLDSPTQLAILLYDVFKIPPVDKRNPRGTGAEILEKIDHPLVSAILDNRFFNKQLSTYVDKIPNLVHADGRVHCKFNQVGADTGRTSSDSPNLQNIPSTPRKLTTGDVIDAGHDVRQFFSAPEGKVLLSCDYSGQEVRVTAHISHDQKMIKAYQDGKDVYVEIASLAYGVPYEECLENRPDGTTNPEGKARRGSAKKIVLGILYGRQIPSIAEQLGISTREAQVIYDKVLNSFPELAQFIQESEDMAREHGWVETVWGRRRQLPEMQLPLYEFEYEDGVNPDFDPLADDDENISTEVPLSLVEEYTEKLYRCRSYKQKLNILDSLKAQGISVKDNTMKISDAQRQCVNCVDFETEILTTTGWKKYNEVKENDSILSYHMEKNQITLDTVKQVHIYEGTQDVVRFKHFCFDAMSTPEHRWVCQQQNQPSRFVTTEHICKNKWPDYPILKIADNSFEDNVNISDAELKLLGWLMTDGSYTPPTKPYHMNLHQGTRATKNLTVYNEMISVLGELEYSYNDLLRNDGYHDIYINKCSFTDWVRHTFPNRVLTFEFISTLSMRQARILVDSMIQGDGTTCDGYTTLCCRSLERVNVFQYLCCVAGYATNYHVCDDSSLGKHYGNVSNKEGYIETKNIYYNVSILKRKKAHIYPKHRTLTQTDGVWCVTTGNGTWIARRNGCVYITGNSRVQGSAADLTKLAMIELYNCQELKDLGFKMLIPVHDEIIAECPKENSARCAELMSEMMLKAGRDLCVPLKCDTDAFYHWYGEKLDPATLEPLGH